MDFYSPVNSHFSVSPLPFAKTNKLLLDDNRRKTMAATIDAVCSRVAKERQKKTDKGMSLVDVAKELGSEEVHQKKACMKEVCENDSDQTKKPLSDFTGMLPVTSQKPCLVGERHYRCTMVFP